MNPDQAAARGGYPTLEELRPLLQAHLERLTAGAAPERGQPHPQGGPGPVPGPGRRIRRALFSLTVPTGGGKTLASLAFALEHAIRHNLDRIIYVIPYTSIIEQTADVFRGIFGPAVIEHHSSLEPSRETRQNRLASENWDGPLIVTTSVPVSSNPCLRINPAVAASSTTSWVRWSFWTRPSSCPRICSAPSSTFWTSCGPTTGSARCFARPPNRPWTAWTALISR